MIRVLALPQPGMVDVPSWKIWSFAGATDTTGLYGVGGTPPERRLLKWRGMQGTTEYPPLALYEIGAMGKIYQRIDPLFDDSPALTMLIKTPGLAAEILLVAVLLTWGRRVLGDRAATYAALAFWLNPAVVLGGAVLGYLDAQMAVPAVLAVLALAGGRPALAGAFAAAAVLTKAQAVFVVPVLAVAAAASGDRRARPLLPFLAGGVGATAAILAPIAVRGALPNMVQALARLGAHDMLSGNALNVWWIATWYARVVDSLNDMALSSALTLTVRILGITDWSRLYSNPRPFATAVVLLCWAWGTWRASRRADLATTAAASAWCVYAYTMFGVQVHENHLFLAVPLAGLAAAVDPAWRRPFIALSAMVALNLYVFYGLGEGWPILLRRDWTAIDLTVWLSVVNVAIFVWWTRMMSRRTAQTLRLES
ncbi:MAG: hypothetical protein IT184_16600 [Acidobacteria bacterium]|nr:hypothetical protein [Acidobacteriota bacterium]